MYLQTTRILFGLTVAAMLAACGGSSSGDNNADGSGFSVTDPQASATGIGDRAGQNVPLRVISVESASVGITR